MTTDPIPTGTDDDKTPDSGNADNAASAAPTSAQTSIQVQALLRLRAMILDGELQGGARIAELAIVDKLGFSRTPIRAALMRLEQEGLLDALPNGGYAVKTFSESDISDAIELRGTLEGLSARLCAERGATRLAQRNLREAVMNQASSPMPGVRLIRKRN